MSTSNCIWLAFKKSMSLLLAHVVLSILFVASPSYAAVHGNGNFTPSKQASTILFIDADVQDSQQLLSGVTAGTDVIRLQGDSDGVQQIAAALRSYRNLDSIQIVSHGAPGKLALGSASLTDANLDRYQPTLQAWGSSLKPHGDILLYGCNVAQGTEGDRFVERIAAATNGVVAASTDATGSSALGGNWLLEKQTGRINANPVIADTALFGYQHLLASIGTQVTSTFDVSGASGADLGATVNENGFTYTYAAGADTIWGAPGFGSGGTAGIVLGGANGSSETLTITNTGGSTFKFTSFYLNGGGFGHGTWTITGKRAGATIGSQTINTGADGSAGGVVGTQTLNANTFLQNVDTIVISLAAGTVGFNSSYLDSFVFDPVPAPTVTAISPTSGPIAGGTNVTITGTNFTGATSVTIGGVSATSVVVASDTSITATTPAGTAGAQNVVVTTPTGTGTGSGLFTYVTVPGAPTAATATAGDTQATVTFTAPASNGGSAITTYTATSNPGSFTGTCSGPTACPVTVTGLTNGTAYTFTVTATNVIGTGTASSASNSVTPKASQTITFSNPGARNFGTTPTLTATASSGLTVAFTSSTTGVCTITAGGALTFVTAGTCTINADQAGNGSFSAAPTVTQSFAVNPVVPGAPTIGTATAGDTQASITFSAPASNGGASITGYTATSSPGNITGTCASSPCTVTGLTNGTAYTFTVTATNSAGTGAASAASNSVTPAASQTITFANPGAQNFGTSPTLTATASSGLTVAFTSSTTGVCTITTGGALTFATTGTCTINADQAGNGSFSAAPTVTQSFAVNAVVPGAPTIGSATAGNAQASIIFTAPASTGGASITGYTATSNPGGLTGTCASSPCTVTGLTNGTAYTFTVTATNSAGTGAASAASNSVTPTALTSQTITFANPGAQNFGTTPTLTATATSGLTVAFTSSTTGVCTITAGGALTFVTTGTCTINADQAGNGSFSAAPTVTRSFAVNAVVPGAPTGASATGGNAQASVTFTAPASNGGSAITTYTATSSPGSLTGTCAGPAACAITVTGLTNGTAYTFTVTATNSAGTGAASAASNSVTPAATVPGAPTGAAASAGNAQATVSFSAPASNGGSAITGYTVTSSPAGGVDSNAGTTGLSHTITGLTNGTAYTFTVTATNAVGTGAPSAASNSVTPLAVVPGAPTGVAATAGNTQATVSFSAPASNGGSAITGYTVTSSPAGGVDSNAGTTGLSHTITGLTNGTAYTFTVTATNAVGTGAPSAASNSITPTAVPTAGSATMQFQLNTPVTLDLAPFISGTSIRVVTAPAHGVATVNGTQVTYTPITNYFGSDTFSYVSANGAVSSTAAVVTVSFVGPRPDPTKDANVAGLVYQQKETAKRFWRAQISNFQQRLESLHHEVHDGAEAASQPVASRTTTNADRIGRNAASNLSQDTVRSPRSGPFKELTALSNESGSGIFPNLLTGSLLPILTTASINLNMASLIGNEKPAVGNEERLNLWGAGNVRIGKINQQAGGADIDYTTDGISFGADRRFGERVTLGMGVGYAHDKSTIGTDGSGGTTNGNSIVGYGSYQYSPKIFIDGLLGYGTLSLDSTRYVAAVNDFAKASRSGSQIFGSLSSGYEYRGKNSLMSPYARYDFAIDRLDAVTETGAGLNALNYARQTNKTQQISLGLRAESMLNTDFGALLPRARVEYQHHFESNNQASIAYADLPGSTYSLVVPTTNSNRLLLGIGSAFVLKNGLSMELNYQWMHSAGSESSQAIFFGLSKTLGGK